MYINRIGQKKKKQAVRRLSQSSGGHGNRREDAPGRFGVKRRVATSSLDGQMEEGPESRPFRSGIRRRLGLPQTATKKHVSPLANTVLTQGSTSGSPSKQETSNVFTKQAVASKNGNDKESKTENIFGISVFKPSPTQANAPEIFQSKNPTTAVITPQQKTQNIFGRKSNSPGQGIFSRTKQFGTKTDTSNAKTIKSHVSPLASNSAGGIVSGLSHQANVESSNVPTNTLNIFATSSSVTSSTTNMQNKPSIFGSAGIPTPGGTTSSNFKTSQSSNSFATEPFLTTSSIFGGAALPSNSTNAMNKPNTFALGSNSGSETFGVNTDPSKRIVFGDTGFTIISATNNAGLFTSPPSVATGPISTAPDNIFGSAEKPSDSPNKIGVFTFSKPSSNPGPGANIPFDINSEVSSKTANVFGNAGLSTNSSSQQKTPGIFSALLEQKQGPCTSGITDPGFARLPDSGNMLGSAGQSITFSSGSVFGNPNSGTFQNVASTTGKSSIFSQTQESNTQNSSGVFSMPGDGGKPSGARSVFGRQIQDKKKKVSPKGIKRSLSSQDISDLTSIVIKGLTREFFDKKLLEKEFRIFGANKISFQPSKQSIVVTFATHESARQAKSKASGLFPTQDVHVFWCRKKVTGRSSKTPEKSPYSKKESRSRRQSISNALNSIDVSQFPPAWSAQERFTVLEEVDKRIRQAITPYRDIANAPVIIGVCCDMCPEKERYMREFQANLSIFEMVPGTQDNRDGDVPKVEHTKAIKEYSRSAADKLEPLAHELRPVHVLEMTLDYLMTNVMDNSEEKWGEWFNFLWNRTRAIRKDITQQHLCDLQSAELVEKITRFHIFCAHYLCEEDVHSFDPKINNENLTKCLQTLKQFYVDLYSDQKVKCPNESEFQAYDILLNLNEGDTLRKAMQYRLEVRNSSEVKFALGVFSSLNSNNFVRFFKLVKSASYLNACIMHRYFTQVRSSALQIMTKAYLPKEPYPLQVLQQLLAFENIDEASRFCSHYNFTTTEDSVQFSKMPFTDPERAFPLQKASNVIESKRNCFIGEVVNGSPLTSHAIHEPVSSFDVNGRYIGLSNLAQMLSSTPDTPEPESPYDVYEPPVNASFEQRSPVVATPADDPRVIFNKAIESTCIDLLEQVVVELLKDISEDAVHQVLRLRHQVTEAFSNKFIDESLLIMVKEIVVECIEKESEIKRRKIAIADSRRRMSVVVLHEIVEEFLKTELASLAGDAKRVVHQQMKAQSFAKMSALIMREMLEDVMYKQCQEIALTTRKEVVREKKAMLMKRTEILRRNKLRKYFRIWSKMYQTRVHIRHILEEIPAKPPMLTVKQQLEKLLSNKDSTANVLTSPPSYTSVIKRREEFQKLLTDIVNEREMKRLRAMQPINLTRLHTELAASKLVSSKRDESDSSKYVKLIVSFPNHVEHFSSQSTESFIKFKLRAVNPDHCRKVPAELQGKFEQLSEIQENSSQSFEFKYDIKACYGVPTNDELRTAQRHHLLLGLTGILFILDTNDQACDEMFWSNCQRRLQKILRSKPRVPRIPLVIMNINTAITDKQSALEEKLGIEEFQREGLLSECVIYEQREPMDSDELHKQLVHAILWLMSHCPKFPSIERYTLKGFVEKEILRHFTIPVCEETALRKKALLQPQCPEVIVDLYNSVIDYVIAVVTNIKLKDISLPVPEFATVDSPPASWNSSETFHRLRSVLGKLKLPMPTSAATDGTWHSESVLCLDYINVLLEEEPLKKFSFALINRVERILIAYAKDSRDLSSTTLTAADFPWPQVIEACIKSLLSWLHTLSDGTVENVYYLPEDLDGFKQPSLWTEAVPETFRLVIETSAERKKKRMESKLCDLSTQVEQELTRLETSRLRLDVSERESFVEEDLLETTRHFERNLWKEKRNWKRFEDELRSVLDEEDFEGLSPCANGQGVKRKNPSWTTGFRPEKTSVKRGSAIGLEDINLPDLNSTASYLETSLVSLRDGLEFHRHLENVTERKLKEAFEDSFG